MPVQAVGQRFGALPVAIRPLDYGTAGAGGTTFGHYRTTHRCAIVNNQAANSRLWTIRNSGTAFIVPTRMTVQVLPTGNHTAAIEDSFDLYKCTGFTVSDNTNQVTPATSVIDGSKMAAAPGHGEIRGLTAAGNSAGITGGTLVKDTNPLYQLPVFFLATLSTTLVQTFSRDFFNEDMGEHPLVLAPNEGLELENRVLLGAAAAASVYVDFSYAEMSAF